MDAKQAGNAIMRVKTRLYSTGENTNSCKVVPITEGDCGYCPSSVTESASSSRQGKPVNTRTEREAGAT